MRFRNWLAGCVAGIAVACSPQQITAQPTIGGIFQTPVQTDMTPAQEAALDRLREAYGGEKVFVLQTRNGWASRFNEVDLGRELSTNKALGFFEGSGPAIKSWAAPDGIPNLPQTFTTATTDGNSIAGTVISGNDKYLLRPLGGGMHAIVSVDDATRPPDEPERAFDQPQGTAPVLPQPSPTLAPSGSVSDITILVVYTRQATDRITPVFTSIDLFERTMFEESNRAFATNGIPARFVSAGRRTVDFVSTDYEREVRALMQPADGVLDDVHAWRAAARADVVALIVDNSQYCGIAAEIGAVASQGFVLVNYECATGYYSFAHEIGHLAGARHNPEADSTPGYAHGHFVQGPTPQTKGWRSIMSYDCPGKCTRHPVWSDPNLNLATGQPMGVSGARDNTREWKARTAALANFFESLPPPGADIPPVPPSTPAVDSRPN